MPVWTGWWAMPASLEESFQHQAVEGDLEAVFDLDLDGGFHVADEDEQGAVRLPLQPHEVEVAPEQPAGQFDLQAGLEEQDGLAGLELAGLGDDLLLLSGRLWDLAVLGGVVDGAEALAEGLLDALLELVARQRQQGRDPLGGHVVVFHEVLPGPFRQAESQESLALLQAHELRYVRGRQPHRTVWQAGQGVKPSHPAWVVCPRMSALEAGSPREYPSSKESLMTSFRSYNFAGLRHRTSYLNRRLPAASRA